MAIKLHEEIVAILKEAGEKLRTKEIADKVNQRKNYLKKDGSEVIPFQIHGRTKNYPDLFYREGNYVGLIEWQKEFSKSDQTNKTVTLHEEIENILKENHEALSTKVIADTINHRNIYKRVDGSPVTPGQIYGRAKNYPKVFTVDGDLIGLVEWNYEHDNPDFWETVSLVENIPSSRDVELKKTPICIDSISIQNFKPYGEKQVLQLKPITLLFGPNSSGKSSIIHALLYIHNAFYTKNLDTYFMKISGDSVDLGGFKQLIYKKDYLRSFIFSISLNIENTKLKEAFPRVKNLKIGVEIRQKYVEKKRNKVLRIEDGVKKYAEIPTGDMIPVGDPAIVKYEIYTDDSILLKMGSPYESESKDYNMSHYRIESLNKDNEPLKDLIEAILLSNTTTSQINPEDWLVIEEAMDDLVQELYSVTSFMPDNIKKQKSPSEKDPNTLSAISKNQRDIDLVKSFNLFFPFRLNEILNQISALIEEQLTTLVYLGPIRSYPPRHLPVTSNNDPNWIAGGGKAWEEIRDNSELREKINDWLSGKKNKKLTTKYRLEVTKYVGLNANDMESQLTEAAKEIEFGLTELNNNYDEDKILEVIKNKLDVPGAIEGINDLGFYDIDKQTSVSHRDVGFGISQVIPVLVSLYGNQNKIIMIEQPEIHLHPALQAELGNVVVESALGPSQNKLILENHSETMMLRILKLIRETTLKKNKDLPSVTPDDVSLIFVENTKNGAVLRNLRIDPMGKIIDPIPGGFFEEDFEELF